MPEEAHLPTRLQSARRRERRVQPSTRDPARADARPKGPERVRRRWAGRSSLSALLALTMVLAPQGLQGAIQESAGEEETVASPPQILATENFTMRFGSRVQVRYTHDMPDVAANSGSFGIRRGRFSVQGDAYRDFTYAVQLELSGGSARLIDALVSYELNPYATLSVGQAKAPFGRQQLNSSGSLHFVDRTMVDGRFTPGRQQGISIHGAGGGDLVEYGVGLYNGNGINSANDNGKFLQAGRIVFTPLGSYSPRESAHDYPTSPRIAVGAGALSTETGSGTAAERIRRIGLEGAFKVHGLNVTGEYFLERAEGTDGIEGETTGWYAQAGYLLPDRTHELALRYASLSPPAAEGASVTDVERGVALSRYFHDHAAKLQADFIQIDRGAPGVTDRQVRVQLQLSM